MIPEDSFTSLIIKRKTHSIILLSILDNCRMPDMRLYYSLKNHYQNLKTNSKKPARFHENHTGKRLESSFFAFLNTLARFIDSHENLLRCITVVVYISRKVDVYHFLDNDDEATLLELVNQDKIEKYATSEFKDDFCHVC